ncbi:hypothetical protein BKA70DRAFT_1234840 [Coprinopsis sp. MPI-PUGE-AT-0042]|nr:hypothetical protein BKA70DRAFT_1234840 [Coprinopsis sp. MPI-PUGE-AT-0042]
MADKMLEWGKDAENSTLASIVEAGTRYENYLRTRKTYHSSKASRNQREPERYTPKPLSDFALKEPRATTSTALVPVKSAVKFAPEDNSGLRKSEEPEIEGEAAEDTDHLAAIDYGGYGSQYESEEEYELPLSDYGVESDPEEVYMERMMRFRCDPEDNLELYGSDSGMEDEIVHVRAMVDVHKGEHPAQRDLPVYISSLALQRPLRTRQERQCMIAIFLETSSHPCSD